MTDGVKLNLKEIEIKATKKKFFLNNEKKQTGDTQYPLALTHYNRVCVYAGLLDLVQERAQVFAKTLGRLSALVC